MYVFFRVAISSLQLLGCPHVHRCTSGSLCCGSCLVFLWSDACMHESVSVLIQWNRKRQDSKSLPVLTSSPSWMASDGWMGSCCMHRMHVKCVTAQALSNLKAWKKKNKNLKLWKPDPWSEAGVVGMEGLCCRVWLLQVSAGADATAHAWLNMRPVWVLCMQSVNMAADSLMAPDVELVERFWMEVEHRVPGTLNSFRQLNEKWNRWRVPVKVDDCFFLC